MTANIRHIGGSSVRPPNGVNEVARAAIEDVAERVASGNVVGVSIALQFADGSCGKAVGGFRRSWPTIGALEEMKYDLLQAGADE